MADESSPLLVTTVGETEARPEKASFVSTVINIMKTCMGTGCLALSYASRQGGILLFVIGMVAIGRWNLLCIDRLVKCRDLIVPKEEAPAIGTSTFTLVAWYAFGPVGLHILDTCMVILLHGIIIAYVTAVVSFMGDTIFSSNNVVVDSVATGVAMAVLSLVPDLSFLAGASAMGLVVLCGVFVIITIYGIIERNEVDNDLEELAFWPGSWNGVSHWFGIVVFGYGAVPLTFNFEESMNEPHRIVEASSVAIWIVALVYLVIGVGLYWLFPDLQADVLHEIPENGWIPLFTRLFLSATVVATAPLLIVPCSQLLEGRWQLARNSLSVRFGIVGVCVIISALLPGFVRAVSLVGCFCVPLVSFCFPPLLHWRLSEHTDIADVTLFVVGVVVTLVTTLCVLRNGGS